MPDHPTSPAKKKSRRRFSEHADTAARWRRPDGRCGGPPRLAGWAALKKLAVNAADDPVGVDGALARRSDARHIKSVSGL